MTSELPRGVAMVLARLLTMTESEIERAASAIHQHEGAVLVQVSQALHSGSAIPDITVCGMERLMSGAGPDLRRILMIHIKTQLNKLYLAFPAYADISDVEPEQPVTGGTMNEQSLSVTPLRYHEPVSIEHADYLPDQMEVNRRIAQLERHVFGHDHRPGAEIKG